MGTEQVFNAAEINTLSDKLGNILLNPLRQKETKQVEILRARLVRTWPDQAGQNMTWLHIHVCWVGMKPFNDHACRTGCHPTLAEMASPLRCKPERASVEQRNWRVSCELPLLREALCRYGNFYYFEDLYYFVLLPFVFVLKKLHCIMIEFFLLWLILTILVDWFHKNDISTQHLDFHE